MIELSNFQSYKCFHVAEKRRECRPRLLGQLFALVWKSTKGLTDAGKPLKENHGHNLGQVSRYGEHGRCSL